MAANYLQLMDLENESSTWSVFDADWKWSSFNDLNDSSPEEHGNSTFIHSSLNNSVSSSSSSNMELIRNICEVYMTTCTPLCSPTCSMPYLRGLPVATNCIDWHRRQRTFSDDPLPP
jgi:hypothetical protein